MKTNRILSRVLSGLLVALGFTGCDGSDTPEEYGTPSVKFQVKGTVTDEAGNPIENIRVIVRGNYDNEPNPWMDDTIYTDRDGSVIFKKYSLMGGLTEFAGQLCETLNRTTGRAAVITDRDNTIAVAGAPRRELTSIRPGRRGSPCAPMTEGSFWTSQPPSCPRGTCWAV